MEEMLQNVRLAPFSRLRIKGWTCLQSQLELFVRAIAEELDGTIALDLGVEDKLDLVLTASVKWIGRKQNGITFPSAS